MCPTIQTEGFYFSVAEQNRMNAYIFANGGCMPPPDRGSIWVDFGYGGTERGTESEPYNTLGEGINAVDAGGTINIRAGSTGERPSTNKAQTWKAVGGWVTIGR